MRKAAARVNIRATKRPEQARAPIARNQKGGLSDLARARFRKSSIADEYWTYAVRRRRWL
jgi:hypothetical protein